MSLRSATEPLDDTSTGKSMDGVLDNDVRSASLLAGSRVKVALREFTA